MCRVGRSDDGAFVTEFTDYGDRAREFSVSVSSLTTEHGTYGYGLVLRDVTSLNRQIRDLEQQSEQLERFASTLSHDLRNPLNVANARANGWTVHAEEGEAGGTRIVFTGVDVLARTPAATASTDD